MSRDVKPLHNESSALVSASREQIFAYLDDHKRLTLHMSQRSWRMGWSSMRTIFDAFAGQEIGSHIRMSGRILGLKLSLNEVVTEREPPARKVWETIGAPRLLVIGPYRMGFELTSQGNGSLLRVFIEYALPSSWPEHWLGWLFGGYYARWCTQRMVNDAVQQVAAHATTTAMAAA